MSIRQLVLDQVGDTNPRSLACIIGLKTQPPFHRYTHTDKPRKRRTGKERERERKIFVKLLFQREREREREGEREREKERKRERYAEPISCGGRPAAAWGT